MTTTISNGATTLTPLQLGPYVVDQVAGNLIHPIIGSAAPATTLRPAALRTGTLTLVCGQNATLAAQIQSLLTSAAPLTLADTTVPSIGMNFILAPGGKAELQLDTDTSTVWSVVFDFQEIGS